MEKCGLGWEGWTEVIAGDRRSDSIGLTATSMGDRMAVDDGLTQADCGLLKLMEDLMALWSVMIAQEMRVLSSERML